jgi:hypothetical protein
MDEILSGKKSSENFLASPGHIFQPFLHRRDSFRPRERTEAAIGFESK